MYISFIEFFFILTDFLENLLHCLKILGGFPIEIETQISKLITYSLANKLAYLCFYVSISIGNPPLFF